MPDPSTTPKREGKLVRTVLKPALKFLLRSQVEAIDTLDIEIQGGDRQILSGQIPEITIAATQAIYRGLHLGQLQLIGQNIRMNLGQVVRGKPLRLLEPIRVQAQLTIREEEFNTSLQSPLLEPLLEPGLEAIASWLSEPSSGTYPSGTKPPVPNPLPSATQPTATQPTTQSTATQPTTQPNRTGPLSPLQLEDLQLGFGAGVIQLRANGVRDGEWRSPIHLQAQVKVESDRLSLTQLQWSSPPAPGLRQDLSDFPLASITLGEDVSLETFRLMPGQIICEGQLTIHP